MENFFKKNLIWLKDKTNKTFADIGLYVGCSANTVSNWAKQDFEPKMSELEKMAQFFEVTILDLLYSDLSNGNLLDRVAYFKNTPFGNLDRNVSGNLKTQNEPVHITIVADPHAEYEGQMVPVPITDISVAAGSGIYNQDYVSNVDVIRLPAQFLKRGSTYLCVKIKGPSMAPTLQDGGYVIIRLLDRGEWAKMQDERVFVVVDNEGKAYLKRVKNRFKQGFIVLRSDSPDKINFPSFNLAIDEINTIWIAEWYFTAKMPNIHDQYYTRLQLLEDRFEELISGRLKLK